MRNKNDRSFDSLEENKEKKEFDDNNNDDEGSASQPLRLVSVKNKWNSPWIQHKTLTFDILKKNNKEDLLPPEPRRGTYGGRTDQQHDATGFFYVKQQKHGWTLIDPDGHPFVCSAINSVIPFNKNSHYTPQFKQAFGGNKKHTQQWAVETHRCLFQELGITALGCWSEDGVFREHGIRVPYCPRWNFMSTYKPKKYMNQQGVIPVFDPEFEAHCDERAKLLVDTKDDPWLLGHFSDNELPLKQNNIIKLYLKLDHTDHGHKAAAKWLKERNKTPNDITGKDNKEFAILVIGEYYRIVNAAIKKYDPNHLFIGSRFHGQILNQDAAFIACGPYVDVVSANIYHRWTANQKDMNRWASLSGRPIMSTEWYAKGEDSGLTNEIGAGFSVATQEDRAAFYENYVMSLMRNPNIVGWHYFKYIDDVVNSMNAGLFSRAYKPWPPLAAAFQTINSRLYSLSDYMSTAKNPDLFLDEDETAQGKKTGKNGGKR